VLAGLVYHYWSFLLKSFLCAGYPRLLAGDMRLKNKIHHQQKTLFPGLETEKPWDTPNTIKRHFLSFPFYPFRTCNTRELAALAPLSPFGSSAPIFPAHTQLNISFKRRNVGTLLNYMLPYNLNYTKGSSNKQLTLPERTTALTFSVKDELTLKEYTITGIEFILHDIYLQVTIRLIFNFFNLNPNNGLLLGQPYSL